MLEELESRTLLTADTTVVSDIDGGNADAAAYLVDFAAGDQPAMPAPAAPVAPPKSTFTGAIVAPTSTPAAQDDGSQTPTPPQRAAASTTQTSRAASDFRFVLRPGSGFTGPMSQPHPIGNPGDVGYDAKAIARWDVVPYQTFDGMFNVGVVAFHMNNIEKVTFSANGGDWTEVRTMTVNPQTDVYEYTATLRASDFNDGSLEVRAVAYPKIGEPRVLESITLFANSGHSFVSPLFHVKPSVGSDDNPGTAAQPFASLRRALRNVPNGATIILDEPGRYDANRYSEGGHTNVLVDRWVTVKPAAQLTRDQVVIVSNESGRQPMAARVNRIAWDGVSFDWSTFSYFAQPDQWLENCRMFDANGWSADYQSQGSAAPFALYDTPETQTGPHHTFVTNSHAEGMLYGWSFVTLVRNSTAHRISGAAYVMSQAVINCSVSDFNSGAGLGYHRDVFHLWGKNDNVIYYGVTATQGIEAQVFNIETTAAGSANPKNQNIAFVDIDAVPIPVANGNEPNFGGPSWSQLFGTQEHVLFLNVNMPTQRFLMDPTDTGSQWTFRARNMVFKNIGLHWWTYNEYVDTPSVIFPGVTWVSCFPASLPSPG